MKIKKSTLRKIIREEAGPLSEGCPADLPCPYAAAEELRSSGSSLEDVVGWVSTVVSTYMNGTQAGEEGAELAHDIPGDGMHPLELSLESRNRARRDTKTLSSRQVRRIIRESVVGPGELVRRPSKPTIPKKKKT